MPRKAERALSQFFEQNNDDPQKIVKCGLFINSTISLEGVIDWLGKQGYIGSQQPHLGCLTGILLLHF